MSTKAKYTDKPMTSAELAAIKARYDSATGGAWYFEEQYGPHFLASEHHGYLNGIGDLIGFGDGEQADADRDFVQHAKQDMAALLDEVERLRAACSNPDFTCLTGQYCDGCQASDDADAAKDRELEDLRAENARLRSAGDAS